MRWSLSDVGRSAPAAEGERERAHSDVGERCGELAQVGVEELRPVSLGGHVEPRVLQCQSKPRSSHIDRVAGRSVAPAAAVDRSDLDAELVTLVEGPVGG